MMTFLFYYAIGGFIFNLVWDLLVSFLANKNIVSENTRLSGKERLFVGLIWPYGLVLFIYHLIESLNEK